MTTRLQLRSAVLVFALLQAASKSAGGAGGPAVPPPTAPPTFFESIDVEVVSLDVVVTDRKGRAVTGLGRDDFTVFEDGKPVAITNFYVGEGQAGGAPPAPPEIATLQASGAPSRPRAAAEQRLLLAIFVDSRNLTPGSRNGVLRRLRDLVALRVGPDDQILLVGYDGRLEIARPPRGDAAALNAALERLMRTSAAGLQQAADLRRIVNELGQAAVPSGASIGPDSSALQVSELYSGVRLYAQARYDEVRGTLAVLGRFVDSLAGLPGRKALVYVSGGLSLHPGEALFQAFDLKYGRIGAMRNIGSPQADARQLDTTPLLRKVAERANAGRVTFYPIAALEDFSGHSAESGASGVLPAEAAAVESFNRASPMEMLAGLTGGSATLDEAGAAGLLEQMRRDLGSYYSLGYAAPHQRDGALHTMRVELRDRGLSARYRSAYRSRTAAELTAARTVSALLLGVAENPLGVGVDFGQQSRDAKGKLQLEVTIKVPMANLVLLPQEHFHLGRLAIFVGSTDGAGKSSEITRIAAPIKVPNEQMQTALGQSVGYRTNLLVEPGAFTLAVSVRDEVGNADSTLLAAYDPRQTPPPPDSQPPIERR